MPVAIRKEQTTWAEGYRAAYAGRRVKVMVTYGGPQGAEAAIDELRRVGLPADAEVLFAVPNTMIPISSSMRRPGLFPSSWSVRTEALPGIGLVGDEATEVAREWGADLIVVGSQGSPKVEPPYFACSSPGVAARAHCSVRIARRGDLGTGTPRRLLVAVDGSPGAAAAVRAVADRAWPPGTAARIVMVEERTAGTAPRSAPSPAGAFADRGDSRPADARLALEEAADVLRSAGLEVSTEIRRGNPAEEIVAAARDWDAGCIVAGSHGLHRARLGGVAGAGLGAVSQALARRAPLSVEIVRGRPAHAAPRDATWRTLQ